MAHEQTALLGDLEPQKSNKVNTTKILAGLVGVFLASADKSILLATQGEIASSLHAPSSAPLLLVSYNLGFCVALPVYGFLSDIYGCRRFLLLAYALFGVGCLISGSVQTLWPFVFGRFVAGIGGAGMTDLLSVLVNEMFCITQIASVRSFVIAAGILGQGCGGPLGGLVADMIDWRWSLIGQAPIGLLCLALAHWQLPASAKRIHSSSNISLWSFDYFGLATFFITVTSFILATTDGGILFQSNTPVILAVSCLFLVAFVLVECFGTKMPMIPPSVVCAPGLGGILFGQVIFFASISTILNNLPPYLAQINHLSNSAIAMRIWPSGLGLILGSVIAGKAMSKTIQYQKLSLVAIAGSVLSQLLMVLRWANGIQGIEVYYCFPWAMGSGLLLSAQFIALTICAPEDQMASATAVYYLSQQVGQIIGTSVSTAALQGLFRLRLDIGLGDIPLHERTQFIKEILKDYSFTASLPPALQAAVSSSYIEAYQLIPVLAMTLTIVCGAIIAFSRERATIK
ncbi:MFS general substrate transporter [Penicillium paradoxum]|uniref:MFS general substrate transporter n=1 Tax=Penicillium paradoxum TaxID=176176 RepID=UPI002547A4F5|nr:MFS general substrate transporter [Penicillium paradoxum]KAJ5780601.1 MFS general substrate transporter [Penicillium paradoxum]